LKKIWYKFIQFWKWLYHQLKDPLNLIIFFIVWLVFFSPWWGGYLLYFITKNPWHLSYSSAWLAFWALPFTPALGFIILITIGIRKIINLILSKKTKHKDKNK